MSPGLTWESNRPTSLFSHMLFGRRRVGEGSRSARAGSFSRQKMLSPSGCCALGLQRAQPDHDQHINAALSTEELIGACQARLCMLSTLYQ